MLSKAHTTRPFRSQFARNTFGEDNLPTAPDPLRSLVTKLEARAFRTFLEGVSHEERRRAAFVAHFQWFDSRSKDDVEDLPKVDLKGAEELLREYFPPDGTVVW